LLYGHYLPRHIGGAGGHHVSVALDERYFHFRAFNIRLHLFSLKLTIII
jgi:hypothetical protein